MNRHSKPATAGTQRGSVRSALRFELWALAHDYVGSVATLVEDVRACVVARMAEAVDWSET